VDEHLSRRLMLDCAVHAVVHCYFLGSLWMHDPFASFIAATAVLTNPVLLWLHHGQYTTFTKYRNIVVAGQRLAAVYLSVACFQLSPAALVLPRTAPDMVRVLALCGALPLTACNLLMELPVVWEGASACAGFLILALNSNKLCSSLQDQAVLLQRMSVFTAKLLQLVMSPVVQLPHNYVLPLLKCRALCMFYQITLGFSLPLSIVVIVQHRHLFSYLGAAPIGPHARQVLRDRHRFWGAPTYYHIVLLCLVLSTVAVTTWFLLCLIQAAAKWQ
jgi:hypothetical protein